MYWMQESDDVGTADATQNTATTAGDENVFTESWAKLSDGNVTGEDLAYVGVELGWPIAKAIILIIIVLLVAKWVNSIVTRAASKAKVETTIARFFGSMARWAVLVLGAISILSTFGIEATSFAAVLAAVGFAIGMALSGTLGNVASGLMLLIFRPYKVGDVVSCSGVTGKVFEVGLFTTVFDTPDNRRITVPNGSIFGSTIENITFHPTRRVDVSVGTEYPANLDQARATLLAAAKSVEGVHADPEPVAYLLELGDSSINWAVRVWADTADYWAVREKVTQACKEHLDNAGIGIPFPQMDVHLDKLGD